MTKRTLKNIIKQENDGYVYKTITSFTSASLYGENLTDEEYENRHMNHLISDYEEDGYEVISAECEYVKGMVQVKLYVRIKRSPDQKPKTANKIMYVDRWMRTHGKTKSFKNVIANKLPNGRWLCELELPLVNQTVKANCSTEINAMLVAANKATKAIQNYLKNNPGFKWYPLSKERHWIIYAEEDGYASIRLTEEHHKKIREDLIKAEEESLKAIEKAIKRVGRIIGSIKNLFVQVMDKSYFRDDISKKDLVDKMMNTLNMRDDLHPDMVGYTSDGEHAILIGFIDQNEY